jgi:hypothetical protein
MSINKERELICWKQHTKQKIIMKIKEKSLLYSTPESDLIQYVLDTLHPVFFENKIEAKYFLCVIGDSILKKNVNLIHIINPKSKKFIQELNNICLVYIGTHLWNTFRYKYYDHDYSICRIMRIKDIISQEHIWGPILSTPSFVLDLICVACHYSERYCNSDNYLLQSSNDQNFIDFVFSLKSHTFDSLIHVFTRDFLEIGYTETKPKTENSFTQITWKDMQYLWKQFLDKNNLPNIIFQNKLKNILMNHLATYYNDSLDSFVGISCKYIPTIQLFIEFWEKNIIDMKNTNNSDIIYNNINHNNIIQYDIEYGNVGSADNINNKINTELYEYEISELNFLYKKWCMNENKSMKILNDKQILDLISYFYPNVEISKEKYIYNIQCILWNKQSEIDISLEKFKEELKNQYQNIINIHYGSYISNVYDNSSNIFDIKIGIYDAYIFYCKYNFNIHNTHEQNVNKNYFEKYIYETLYPYIKEDYDENSKYISFEWIM